MQAGWLILDPGDGNANLGTYSTDASYNSNDTQKQAVYPNNETVNFTYDSSGRQTGITNYLSDIQYDAACRPTSMAYQMATDKSLATAFSYNSWNTQGGRLQTKTTTYDTSSTDPILLQNFGYTYDAVGNIAQLNTNDGDKLYNYDALNRVTSTDGVEANNTSYDSNGNIASASAPIFSDTFDAPPINSQHWTYSGNNVSIVSINSSSVLRANGVQNYSLSYIKSSSSNLNNGKAVELRFEVSSLNP